LTIKKLSKGATVKCFTKEFGKLFFFVHSFKKTTKNFHLLKFPLSVHTVIFTSETEPSKSKKHLFNLKEVIPQKVFLADSLKYEEYMMVYYLVDVVDIVSYEFSKDEQLFAILKTVPEILENKKYLWEKVKFIEINILISSGRISFNNLCVKCNRSIKTDTVYFDFYESGFTCKFCNENKAEQFDFNLHEFESLFYLKNGLTYEKAYNKKKINDFFAKIWLYYFEQLPLSKTKAKNLS